MIFLEKEFKEKSYSFYVQKDSQSLWIQYQGQIWLWKKHTTKQKKHTTNLEPINSPIPGKIQKIFVKIGDQVQTGEELLLLSAMKIEYRFKAESDGFVENIFCKTDETVPANKELIKIKYKR